MHLSQQDSNPYSSYSRYRSLSIHRLPGRRIIVPATMLDLTLSIVLSRKALIRERFIYANVLAVVVIDDVWLRMRGLSCLRRELRCGIEVRPDPS